MDSTIHANGSNPPTILQDDQPLDMDNNNNTTTTLSFENGIHPAMMDSNPPSTLTETLSSFSSDRSSFLGGTNNNLLSTFSSTTSTPASRRGSMQFTKPVEVRETLDASVTENADGLRQLKQYVLKREIGRGAFGKVHHAVDENTNISYAVKEFSKSKLRKKDKANLFKLGPRGRGRGRRGPDAPSPLSSESSPLDLIRGEVAILKKLHHPNIVKLYEVLDVSSDDSMYMVFEMCEKGVLMPVSLTEKCEDVFSDDDCRDVFQQMVLGIEYRKQKGRSGTEVDHDPICTIVARVISRFTHPVDILFCSLLILLLSRSLLTVHEHDIIHRDIKPDNLLRSGDGTVKIVDFGVSEMFNKKGDDMTKKSAGSPAFMAPELCRHDHGEVSGRATDIWSMGVTLYCIRYGYLPYVSESILEMHKVIREEEYTIPPEDDQRFVDLIKRLLEKDPVKRITIEQLRNDPWLTNDGTEPLISKEENTANAVTEVTEEDLRGAIQKIGGLVTVFKAITKFKRGIKSPVSRRSSTSTTAGRDDLVTELEKMQDADESHGTISLANTSSESTHDTLKEEIKETSESPVSSTLESSLVHVSLQEIEDKSESEKNHAEAEPTTQPPVQKANEETQDDKPAEEEAEPEGYQMCDMETGMCYWVPSKKVKTTPPVTATVEPKKDVEEKVSEVMQPSAPTIQIASVEHALAPSSTDASHQDDTSSAGQSSSSGASSPTQSLAPGPRLVGKLSRERLAMFEKSA
ncbi:hypothetical protein KVV02_005736 [Mortierella alpina]|uniref:Protein kinase domain-containing protein n=1 Tax=Mortierella alpina TaxID=64518 RepID=A0A9P8AB90_MORAP|nr:hypothetical protein KVV02_005736 [Mortierella alpina]